ncbi:uncharacterized protein LOC102713360 [Oryza brachyantha]|uniref:uncharacterized protein LOC102713360 n=1 Tax=Oryza brachyantha TaxID=4533 RepID=UPI0007769A27|nr:uncharacterized protein LOC102713360 [Oryza brachyantha]
MHGYSNLACSSPPMAARARRSLELTNTKETNPWEGLAIGAVTLARTFSTGSHRISSSSTSRPGGERVARASAAGGLPGAVRRAFSLRRHPAGHGRGDGYYWRIHDMDGDGDDATAAGAGEEDEKNKKEQLAEAVDEKESSAPAKTKTATATATPALKKKTGGKILKACKKLLRL